MSQQTIEAARARHDKEQHQGEFDVCPDLICRIAVAEIQREAAIAAMQRGLRWVDFEKPKRLAKADI